MLVGAPAMAAVVTVGPMDDVEAAINAAEPGDEIVLSGGEYTLSGRFGIDIAGTEAQPIVIRAAKGDHPHLHRPESDQNIIDIDGAAWVEIRGIELSGGSAGIRVSAADHLTIADCELHDTGDVAIRANDGGALYEALHIVHNDIHHTNETGEGMYLGCNANACQVANSIIERNHVHHTNQRSVIQGDGIELKEGSYGNVIRDNVIHDTNYPCILTYSTVGNGEPNVVERNVMWNCGDHGIQSAADTTIRNNIVLSANADGIAMQQHQSGSPQNLVVVHNTILQAQGHAISLRNAEGSVVIANNALYASRGSAVFLGPGDTTGLVMAGNVGVGGVTGGGMGYVEGDPAVDLVDGHYDGAPPIDVFPAMGGALVSAGDPAYVPDDDFNTTLRDGEPDVGAYRYDPAGNPGWMIVEGFKEFPDDGGAGTGGEESGGDETGTGSEGGSVDETGTGGGSVDETSGGPSGGTGSATGGTGDPAGADGGGGGEGCGCRSSGDPRGGLALAFVLGLLRRRRDPGAIAAR